METLESMFPNVEYETLEIVLESQEGNLEAAIEAMLQMSKDSEVPSSSESAGGFKGALPVVSVPDPDPFAGPRNPVIERDDQIRADEMLARSMQQQIISSALQEQTPTCFTPITGMLGGYSSGPSPLASSASAGGPSGNYSSQQAPTLGNTVSSMWNSLSTMGQSVTQTIVDTAQNWMAPVEEDPQDAEGEELSRPMTEADGLAEGHNTSNSFAYSAGASSVAHRRKPRESKKSD
jgi:hypothetical protein